jgi:hypothetical protein
VASAERNGQVHTDTVETFFNPTPFASLFADDGESPTAQWVTGQWGQTTEQAYSPSKSMTDSPFDIYTSEENNLTTSSALLIPNKAIEARLRFFTRWDIEPGLDWAQVLVSTDGGSFFNPLYGLLSNQNLSLNEPVYEGSHPNWEEECIDLHFLINQPFFLRFAMTSFSGNPIGRDGFYFDDLLLEYQTESGVYTLDIPDAWNLQSRPNPAADQTLVVWEQPLNASTDLQLEVFGTSGKLFKQIPLQDPGVHSLKLDTTRWPAGLYFYRISDGTGHSGWKKLTVAH